MQQLSMVNSMPRKVIIPVVLILFSLSAVAGCRGANRAEQPDLTEAPVSKKTKAVGTNNPQGLTNTLLPAKPPIATPTPEPFEPLRFNAPDCNYGGSFKAIESLDRYTVQFSFCQPEPAFLSKIAFPTFGIQPREWLESAGSGSTGSSLLEAPIGSGPYKLEEWKRGEELVFKAFEDYWEEKARTPYLAFRWNRDPAQRLLELQSGTVDGIDNLNSADFDSVEADPALVLVKRPALNVSYLGINNTEPPLDNERVRQAIAMGIDRQRIVDESFPPGYDIASFFTPCAIPNACFGESWYDYDPEKARLLLAEAGYPDGFPIDLFYRDVLRGYLPQPNLVAGEIKAQLWDNLKINVRLETLESEAFLNAVDAGSLPGLHLLGWSADYPDSGNFLDFHFGANASDQFGRKHQDILEALDQASRQGELEARRPFYESSNNAIKRHVPMIPIAHGGWATQESLAVAYKQTVEDAHASPLSLEDFSQMSVPGQDRFVWMQAEEPFSLYCAVETDSESLRACSQITETLYRYQVGGAAPQAGLAQSCTPDDELRVWTCKLHEDVSFHNGSILDANDVLLSLYVQWDADHPLHQGSAGAFHYFRNFWGEFLNAPAK